MNWQTIAAKLAALGLPILGKALAGNIPIVGPLIAMAGGGEAAGSFVARAIALALGVDPTPEAVNDALEKGDTTEVVAKLQAVQGEAVAYWPALAEMEKSENTTDIELAKINEDSYLNRIRGEVATNGFWLSLYRPILNILATADLAVIGYVVTKALIVGGEELDRVVAAYVLIALWTTILGAILGLHWTTRASERKAALTSGTPTATASVKTS